jgi:NodT family efflux transporter outer membrane factor (OMF) lipoprotein
MLVFEPRLRAPFLALPLAVLALSACATPGSERHALPVTAPEAAARGHFLRAPDAATPAPPAARWWTALGDPVLDDLEARALAGSPDLAAAQARIDTARAGFTLARGALAPSVAVSGLAGELSLPGTLLSRNGRLSEQIYADNAQASWELDLFGANHRRADAARERAAAAQASAADVAVSLSAQVARVYLALRAEQANAALLAHQVEDDRRLLSLMQQRVAGGTASAQTVDSARSALAQSESDLAGSGAQITALADQLAVLVGREPGALEDLVAKPAALPQIPAAVAVGDPARLLRHRPDIRAAERQLAASEADLGARIADRFPSVSFTGLLGLGGTSVAQALDPATLIGLVLPQIKWNLFDGGRAKAQVRAARGSRDEAEANYRARVLDALGDAEGALTRFGAARVALGKAIEAHDAAAHLAELQKLRANAGTLSQADALAAERQALRAQLAVVAAQAQMTADFVAVHKALGLGWDDGRPQE